jgi:hypothetical protein
VASEIADAAEETMEGYRRHRFIDEPHITDRLMGEIETKINGLTTAHIGMPLPFGGGIRMPLRWEAMTLRAGPASAAHERRFGADILGVLTVRARDYRNAKGFLAQAKRAEPGTSFDGREWGRLRQQCEKMLALTPDSFIIAYSRRRGVRFFSAQAVASFEGRDLFALYDIGVRSFFERHLQSFIGDRRLDRPEIETLERLEADEPEDERPSEHVLHLAATEVE